MKKNKDPRLEALKTGEKIGPRKQLRMLNHTVRAQEKQATQIKEDKTRQKFDKCKTIRNKQVRTNKCLGQTALSVKIPT